MKLNKKLCGFGSGSSKELEKNYKTNSIDRKCNIYHERILISIWNISSKSIKVQKLPAVPLYFLFIDAVRLDLDNGINFYSTCQTS